MCVNKMSSTFQKNFSTDFYLCVGACGRWQIIYLPSFTPFLLDYKENKQLNSFLTAQVMSLLIRAEHPDNRWVLHAARNKNKKQKHHP